MYDVIIIGAGVSGCAAARELSRFRVKVRVLEREEDVCCGTSKANSGIVHAGYDAVPGSLKARLNLRGNELMQQLSEELDFSFQRTGSMVVCTEKEQIKDLEELYERGRSNGVSGLKILSREDALALEPNLSENTVAALYAETAGIVCPFGLNIALAENAYENGVEFGFGTEVMQIERQTEGYLVHTNNGNFLTRCIVNAAGVYADVFHNMVSDHKIKITPRKGEYCLLDKCVGSHVAHTIFALPNELGKGVLVTPTVHGNLLVGPTAVDIEDKDGTNTTGAGLNQVLKQAQKNVREVPQRQVITSFAGLRAHEDGDDFIIGDPVDSPGFIDCAGIESPGLTSAPAIGEFIAGLLEEKLGLEKNERFISSRKGILNPENLSVSERNELIRENPSYGLIVCRCEQISEGEIIDSIRRPLGARSLDGVKRRTRAGMGRCQSGFCMPRVMEILARELGVDEMDITKSGNGSEILVSENRDVQ